MWAVLTHSSNNPSTTSKLDAVDVQHKVDYFVLNCFKTEINWSHIYSCLWINYMKCNLTGKENIILVRVLNLDWKFIIYNWDIILLSINASTRIILNSHSMIINWLNRWTEKFYYLRFVLNWLNASNLEAAVKMLFILVFKYRQCNHLAITMTFQKKKNWRETMELKKQRGTEKFEFRILHSWAITIIFRHLPFHFPF